MYVYRKVEKKSTLIRERVFKYLTLIHVDTYAVIHLLYKMSDVWTL